MRVCENRVRKKIFGPEREEVSGRWRELHNDDEINDNEVGLACSGHEGDKKGITECCRTL